MNWEIKTKIAELAGSYTDGNRFAFQDFVKQHIDDFDAQACEIYLFSIQLTRAEIEPYVEFHEAILPHLQRHEDAISLSPLVRLSVYEGIIEEIKTTNQ